MTPGQQFLSDARKLYLSCLTDYYDGVDEGPTYPWLANNRIGLLSGMYEELLHTDPVDLYTDNLFERSRYRGGYSVWDFILRNGRTRMRTAHDQDEARGIADLGGTFPKSLNTWWSDTVSNHYMKQTCSSLPYYRDFMVSDGFLLDAAHGLAHRYGDDMIEALAFWKSYASLSRIFVQYLADLYVASEFGIPIDLHQPPGQTLAWGVAARPTLRTGFTANRPVLQEKYTYSLLPDRNFCYVNVAIEVGADPLGVIVPGERSTDEDRLSYQPRRLFCVGWALAPWVFCQDVRRTEQIGWDKAPKASFTVLCEDMFAPHALPWYLEEAKKNNLGCTDYHRPLEDWKEELGALICVTGMLPCDHCILFNRQIGDGLRLPSRKLSWKTADKKEQNDYRKKLRNALKMVHKASARLHGKGYRKLRKQRSDMHKAIRIKRRNEAKSCRKDRYGYFR